MEIQGLVFTLSGWQAVLAVFGPLAVGGLTALSTSSKAKMTIAIIIMVATAAIQAVLTGGFTNDVFANLLLIVAIWQSSFSTWKAFGLTKFLQEKIPIQLFAGSK